MTIYDLECPSCKKRANFNVIDLNFKAEQGGNPMLQMLCECTYCNKNVLINASILKWGEITTTPVEFQDAEVEPEIEPQKNSIEIPAMEEDFVDYIDYKDGPEESAISTFNI